MNTFLDTVLFIIAATAVIIAIATVTRVGPQPVLDRSLALYQELEAEAAVDWQNSIQSLRQFRADSYRDYWSTK